MQLGFSFVFQSGRDGYHLWVVTSDPFQNDKEILTVNLTTVRDLPHEDRSCLVQPGEHPRIDKPSYARYDYAECHDYAYFERICKGTIIYEHPPVSPILLRRIQQGALISRKIKKKYAALLRSQGCLLPSEE